MSGISKTLQTMLLGGILFSTGAFAQNSATWRDFSYIKGSEAWLTSYNASGLAHLPVDKISIAEVYGNKSNGDFINYYQSDNSYELGAQTESFYRLNSRVVFYGKVNYSYFEGKHMGGSFFINPYNNPFDIVEYEDDTQGNKELETYHLVGAVSGEIARNLTLGAKIDYKAASYAKDRDVRHVSNLMDMHVTAGLSYRINSSIEIGANYYYRRNTEGITFSTKGYSDREHRSLISYGAFFGVEEKFKGDGYTKSGSETPLFNEYHGGSLQLNFNITPQMSFFNEFTYKSRDGHYGKRETRSIVYSEHNADVFEYAGMLSYRNDKTLHTLQANVSYEQLDNYENIYRTENPSVGVAETVYYGQLQVLDREEVAVGVTYTGNWGVVDYQPTWTVRAGFDYYNKKQTASVYPHYRKQSIRYTGYKLAADRNIMNGKNMYSISLGTSYFTGGGTALEDGRYSDQGEVPHDNVNRELYREFEYLTNNRITGNVGFKYSRQFDKGINGYAGLNYSLTKASDIQYLKGDKHNVVRLVVGCTF